MHIVIVPGFTGYPEERTFEKLGDVLISNGHKVTKVAWPNIPENMEHYSMTNTLNHIRDRLAASAKNDLVLLGFSMGGIIATVIATEFKPIKLALIVTPYQAGTSDDLAGKYREWKEQGYRELVSSKFGKIKIPFTFLKDAKKYSALDYISKVKCPKLFVVAGSDEKITLKASKMLYKSARTPKVWHLIKNMQHKYQYQEGMMDKVNKLIIEFIEADK